MEEFLSLLRGHDQRLTEPRKRVYETLKSQEAPITIAALARQCHTIDRTSVYRSLELFDKLGIVSTTYRGWKRTYELNAPFKPHHHHFCCLKCRSFIDINSDELETLIACMARDNGFSVSSHVFEISGICADCLLAFDVGKHSSR